MSTQSLALLSGIMLIIAICVVIATATLSLIRPWLQCFLSGAPVPLFQILAMRLRGIPVKKICDQRIKASYIGEDLTVIQLEHAYHQGADIEKLVDALCLARRREQDVDWNELLQTELTDK